MTSRSVPVMLQYSTFALTAIVAYAMFSVNSLTEYLVLIPPRMTRGALQGSI